VVANRIFHCGVFIFTGSIHQEYHVYFSHYYLSPLSNVLGSIRSDKNTQPEAPASLFEARELAMRFSVRMNAIED
jgi:hypothetical protein